jgi:hypothetical protein
MLSKMYDRLSTEYIAELGLQCFSATGDGMHLEAIGRPSAPHDPFMTFRADEQGGMQVLLHGLNGDVAFPLAELKRAIAIAEQEVHPESFFD